MGKLIYNNQAKPQLYKYIYYLIIFNSLCSYLLMKKQKKKRNWSEKKWESKHNNYILCTSYIYKVYITHTHTHLYIYTHIHTRNTTLYRKTNRLNIFFFQNLWLWNYTIKIFQHTKKKKSIFILFLFRPPPPVCFMRILKLSSDPPDNWNKVSVFFLLFFRHSGIFGYCFVFQIS